MAEKSSPRLIIIAGPTAVGKTELAISIAKKIGGEIISADAMQVYRYLDIGTAKPLPEERAIVPHHLIDVADPRDDFNVARFVKEADKTIEKLWNEKKNIFVVGGTGLYIRALIKGIFWGAGQNPTLRQHLKELMEKEGTHSLFELLKKEDPEAAKHIHPHDWVRIIRALEVILSTGISIKTFQKAHGFKNKRYNYLFLGLNIQREKLYKRIEKRCQDMVSRGLVEETECLLSMGYDPQLKPLQSLSYKHIISYLEGKISLDEAIHLMSRDTRHLAKRQWTWFNKESDIQWYHVEDTEKIMGKILDFIDREL
ncbi:MAG: tRNA (adenosine(37)-N6)-dimethylallyltransferase MiaA [Syntrophales bacterium]|nr:tRNA (adenosine(37)-N6)-dimethylallyltransferase MiaA [Syntrophales bacterium]